MALRGLARRWSLAVQGLGLLAVTLACAPAEPGAPDRTWTRPANLEPALAELVDAQLAAIQREPRSAAHIGRLGVIYEANRQWPEAREAFDAAFAMGPGEPLWLVHAALARTNLGDAQGALSILRAHAGKFADCAPLQNALGDLLLEEGDLDGALKAFDLTLRAEPKLPEGHAGRALVELRRGAPDAARLSLERALALDPNFRQAWYPLGLALRALEREAEALAALERGREVRKRRMRDRLNSELASLAVTRDEVIERASVLVGSGRATEAVAKLAPLAKAHPDDGLVQFNLGVALLSAGQLPGALAAFERARSIDANLSGLDSNLALALLSLGRSAEASSAIDRALARDGANPRAHRLRGAVREALGDNSGALESRKRAVELDSRDATSRAEYGRSLAMATQWAQAEEQFRAQIALASGDWRGHANLGRVLYFQGSKLDAIAEVKLAQQAAGADAAVQEELRQLAEQIGN